jgi:hypothetical protein
MTVVHPCWNTDERLLMVGFYQQFRVIAVVGTSQPLQLAWEDARTH